MTAFKLKKIRFQSNYTKFNISDLLWLYGFNSKRDAFVCSYDGKTIAILSNWNNSLSFLLILSSEVTLLVWLAFAPQREKLNIFLFF